MSRKGIVARSLNRCFNGREKEQHLCYLAEPVAVGFVLFLSLCFADANAGIGTTFQADPTILQRVQLRGRNRESLCFEST